MATAGDIIRGALRLIDALGEGETATAEASADGLTALNDMLDSWSTDRLFIYRIVQELLSWPGATQSRTIGSGGNFNTTRPVKIADGCFWRSGTTDYEMTVLRDRAQYDSICTKTTGSSYPEVLFYDTQFPLGVIYLWPVPGAGTLALNSWQQLTEFAGLTTTVQLPPGYREALRYNLALRLAPEYDKTPPPAVVSIAQTSAGKLKRINAPMPTSRIEAVMLAHDRPTFDIYKGY